MDIKFTAKDIGKVCDSTYCKSAEESIKQEIEKMEQRKENLLNILL
jgi:hypothetical protein